MLFAACIDPFFAEKKLALDLNDGAKMPRISELRRNKN